MSKENFSISISKEYLNFSAAHFMVFKDGSREPLHGHNYRLSFWGEARSLNDDMVFDFRKIKPLIKNLCDTLDHRLLLPQQNEQLTIERDELNTKITTPDNSIFSIPTQDILELPIENISVERLACYLSSRIDEIIQEKYDYHFSSSKVEIEESKGQSATFERRD